MAAITTQAVWDVVYYYGIVFFISISFVVFVHELGHYLCARTFGVRISKFSIGFGKELLGFDDRNGTRWSLSCIPLGGYLSIFGDVDPENPQVWDAKQNCARRMTQAEQNVAFFSKALWQRSLIVLGGPVANVILTYTILCLLYVIVGQGYSRPVINTVGIGSAGEAAGFQIGDVILKMDGKEVHELSEIYDKTMDHPGVRYHFEVKRGDHILELGMTPEHAVYEDVQGVPRDHGRTGILNMSRMALKEIHSINGVDVYKNKTKILDMLSNNMDVPIVVGFMFRDDIVDRFLLDVPSKYNKHLFDHVSETKDDYVYLRNPQVHYYKRLGVFESLFVISKDIVKGLDESLKVIEVIHKGKANDSIVAGVGSISGRIGQAAEDGFYTYFQMIAVFSLMIGIINLLPIPVLDGGYLLFFLIEAVRGRPLSQRTQYYAMIFGLVLLGGIMIFANTSDLIHLLG